MRTNQQEGLPTKISEAIDKVRQIYDQEYVKEKLNNQYQVILGGGRQSDMVNT
jgi:alkaline phosphatase